MENSQTEQSTNNSGHAPLTLGLWLSWQELKGRRTVLAINVILVALLVALPVSFDLIGKARKSSIGTRVDYIGPSLILVPRGILSSDLVTAQMKGRSFSASALDLVKSKLSQHLRGWEGRLTARVAVDGRDMPVTGIDFQDVYSYPFSNYKIRSSEVLLGEVAAEKLQKNVGDTVVIGEKTFMVSAVIPTTGEIYDASVFLTLSVLQYFTSSSGRINEVRLFPSSPSSYEALKPLLGEVFGELNLIDAYRGDTAEKGMDSTLTDYQKALYAIAFVLIALCIMISTYINLDGRKAEVSTVFTLGASQGTIFQILIFRTIWITLFGAAAGQLIALMIASLQDVQVPLRLIWSTTSFIEVAAGTLLLGLFVTIPFAFYSVYKRNLIEYL